MLFAVLSHTAGPWGEGIHVWGRMVTKSRQGVQPLWGREGRADACHHEQVLPGDLGHIMEVATVLGFGSAM